MPNARRVRERIAEVARDRARLLAPALFVTVLYYVLADRPLGYETPGFPYAYAWAMVAVLGALSAAFTLRKIPDRWTHLGIAALLWCSASSTLVTLSYTQVAGPVLLVLVQIASAGILLHTRWMVFTVVAISTAAAPLFMEIPGLPAAMCISALVTANVFAVLIHLLVLGSLRRAETAQVIEAETASRLATELEERARLQEQLVHAQRMEAVGTLAAGVAHDMNNVLASIANLAELLGESAAPRQMPDLAQIVTQSRRGAELTRGLLAFSRRGQYRKQVISVAGMVREVIPLLRRTLPKSIAIVDDIVVGDDASIDGDPVHLGQVIINLALNAADAMDRAGTLQIRATLVGDGSQRRAQLEVVDTGHGMDSETRKRLFEPFFTTKPLGKGSGLGLSIAWGIIQAHDGTIEVASEPGRGTTFTIQLPLTNQTATEEAVRIAPTSKLARKVVLIVDDERAVRESSKRLLERMGLDVITAANGDEGLAKFAEHRASIRLVVLDMGMPGMSGAECFGRLRKSSDVPVIIATGYADDEQVRELVAAGARLLEKPFTVAELRRDVSQLLDASRPFAAAS
jgi:signal transduction histidine kinase/CheY-like chemotaxis protein